MEWVVAFIQLFITAHVAKPEYNIGMATTFSAEGDEHNPMPWAACLHRDLRDATDMIIASRDLPCRSKVLVCLPRTNKCVIARVGDRGPFGKKRSGEYRAVMDLAPAVRKYLHHNGYETVWWQSLQTPTSQP